MNAVIGQRASRPHSVGDHARDRGAQFLSDAGRQIAASAQALGYIAERYPLVVGTVATIGAGALLRRRRMAAHRLSNGRAQIAANVVRALLAQMAASSGAAAKAAEDVSYRAREVAASAIADMDGLGEVARRLHEGGHRVQEQVEALARREPLWFGALALALGAFAGRALRRRV